MELSSRESTRISLEAIHNGKASLSARRKSILARAPETGDWAKIRKGYLQIRDLAYLTAYTDHEFAILSGKHFDILFHGERLKCRFDETIEEMLLSGKLEILAHSHPGPSIPIPSPDDRIALKKIGQKESVVISATSAIEQKYGQSAFDGVIGQEAAAGSVPDDAGKKGGNAIC